MSFINYASLVETLAEAGDYGTARVAAALMEQVGQIKSQHSEMSDQTAFELVRSRARLSNPDVQLSVKPLIFYSPGV